MNQPRTLLIEGWRGIPHSYAIVNQFQCLQFLLEPNLTLWHTDVPYAHPKWAPVKGIASPSVEAAITAIPAPPPGVIPDAVYRISYPYAIGPSLGRRTVVFGTAEYGCVALPDVVGKRLVRDACSGCNAIIVTPSNWSRAGFINSGAPTERVKVIPHGVDPGIFHPALAEQRASMRTQLGWDGFMFLSLGAMTANKGVFALLKAFAAVAQKHPHVRLMMKGVGALYPSQGLLATEIGALTPVEKAIIQPRLTYLEKTLGFGDMASLYQSADAYVSPYKAEGFNLPVLEAIACGLPVICTRGGSTDDFTSDEFSLRVNAKPTPVTQGPFKGGTQLSVDVDHLIYQMMTAVESSALAGIARVKGPAFVSKGFTWSHVKRELLKVLFDEQLSVS